MNVAGAILGHMCARAQSVCMTYPPGSTAFAALGGLSFRVNLSRWLKGVGKKLHIRQSRVVPRLLNDHAGKITRVLIPSRNQVLDYDETEAR